MLRTARARLAAAASIAAVALVLAAAPRPLDAGPRLTDLNGVSDLKTLFNRDAGSYRMIVLLSPT